MPATLEAAAQIIERIEYAGRGLDVTEEAKMRTAVLALLGYVSRHVATARKSGQAWAAVPRRRVERLLHGVTSRACLPLPPPEAAMKVSELMTRDVATVTVDETCDAAARIMWERNVGSVPVVDAGGKLVGMITDRDLTMAAHQEKKRLDELPLKAVMTGGVIAAHPDDEVQDVEHLMQENQIRRIPVVDDDARLVGIVALADLVKGRGAQAAETVEAVSQPNA